MTKQKDLITNRFNSLRFCRLCHEIVKYHPEFYDDNGRYLKEEWTSFDDVGRVYEGKVVTIDDYLEIENCFIEITHAILEESGCKFLTLGYVENYRRKAVKEGKRVHALGLLSSYGIARGSVYCIYQQKQRRSIRLVFGLPLYAFVLSHPAQ